MKRLAAIALTGLLTLGVAAPAAAQDDAPKDGPAVSSDTNHRENLDAVTAWAHAAIDIRLEVIAETRTEVEASEHFLDDHQARLLDDLASAEANLRGLAKEVDDATAPAEVLAIIPRVAEETRVFVILLPKVVGVSVSDAIVTVADELELAGEELQAGIDEAARWGLDVAEAQELLDASMATAAEGREIARPVADAVIGLRPADFPVVSGPVVEDAITDLHTGYVTVREAGVLFIESAEALAWAIFG